MIQTALSSSSFIGFSREDILHTAAQLGVDALEWTSDGFLDEGDLEAAYDFMQATLHAGFSVAGYGSLFRTCQHDERQFEKILSTAQALGTSMVRIWAPPETHQIAKEENRFIDTTRRLADIAAEQGICICYNLDAASMLNSFNRAAYLIKEISHDFVKLAWEPVFTMSFDTTMSIFLELKGHIGLMGSRFITPRGVPRSLCQYEEEWSQYLDAFDEQFESPDMARYVLLRPYPGLPAQQIAREVALVKKYSVELRKYRRRRVY